MDLKAVTLILCLYLFSCCTPYWENESLNEIDHGRVTQEITSKEPLNEKKLIPGDNDLMTSALILKEKTTALSNEIEELLIDIEEL